MSALKNMMILALLMLTWQSARAASTFSAMSVEEVSALLSKAAGSADAGAVSAKDAAAASTSAVAGTASPLSLTARDMVTKIYGIVDPGVSRRECVDQAERALRLTPVEDEGALWLETDSGYEVDYYGMAPEVSAMVRFGDGDSAATDFGFFFLFPYTSLTRSRSIDEQAEFCGTLLQELADEGLPMDLNTATDDLFEAVGDYMGSLVDVRLLDDRQDAGNGRYILILSVEPNAFTPDDYQLAALAE